MRFKGIYNSAAYDEFQTQSAEAPVRPREWAHPDDSIINLKVSASEATSVSFSLHNLPNKPRKSMFP